MTFQAPFTLWWFIPIAVTIIVLYLLKIRRREVRVPALFLFPRITTDVRANVPWQRLRWNWLMLLQLLVALSLLFALARPMIRGAGRERKMVVFVLDASASMKAKDIFPDRFTEAKRRIERWLNALSPHDRAALIVAASRPKVVVPLGTNHGRLRQALRQLEPTDAPADIGAALRLGAALILNHPEACLVFLSDGAFGEVPDFSPGKAEFVYEAIGRSDRNVGIIALDGRREGQRLHVFVSLFNFSERPLKGILNWFADGRLVNAQEVTLKPQKGKRRTVAFPPSVREVRVQWECQEDLLPSDDVAYWVGGGQRLVRILSVGKENFFLEQALALEPETVLEKALGVPETERGNGTQGRYDLVIFNGTKPVPVRAKAIWLIGVTDDDLVTRVGEVRHPVVNFWDQSHPVMRYLDLSVVLIDKALRVRVGDWGQVVAEAKGTPLIVAGERRHKRWLYIGWDLLDSDFPLRVGFPIFIANALRWSLGQRKWEQGFTLRAGTSLSLTVPAETVTLKFPDGTTKNLRVPDSRLFLTETERVGIYELQAGQDRLRFAINLSDPQESSITPKQAVTLGGRIYAARVEREGWQDLWRWFLLFALIVLGVEWFVYVRQS